MKLIKIVQYTIIIIANVFALGVIIDNFSSSQPPITHANISQPVIEENSSSAVIDQNDVTDADGKYEQNISYKFDATKEVDPVVLVEVIQSSPIIKGQLLQGDTFDSSLRRKNVPPEIRSLIIKSLSDTLDFKRLKPRDNYTLELAEDGNLKSFIYESSPLDIISLKSTYGGYTVQKTPIDLERHRVRMTGEISSSLFGSFASSREDKRLVFAFADIFASKIDFNTETRRGDRYSIIFDKFLKNGKLIGYGKILAAVYQPAKGKSYEAYYFSSDKTLGTYFDFDGEAVGASFIKSPVPMGRVSSHFTYRRKHPITGVVKPHLGIDLAAPVGTPILAASDGKIISIGRNKGNGRQIIISHNGGLKTYYGHLSRYRKGLKKGSRVSKKQIIGYVGSSGMATGPHLDYRISERGVFKNPFSIKFKPKAVLKDIELTNFQQSRFDLEQDIHNSHFSTIPKVLKVSKLTITSGHDIMLL